MNQRASIEEIRLLLKAIAKGYKVPKILYDTVMTVAKREIEGKNKIVLVKRDPDVNRARIQGYYVKVIEGNSIGVHPCSVGGHGADFDGDSLLCRLVCTVKTIASGQGQTNDIELGINEMLEKFPDMFVFESENTKDNGVNVKKYAFNSENKELYIDSISTEDGSHSLKKITNYSIHDNLEMYKIHDDGGRFEDFWASYDHSLIIYDEEDDSIKTISPKQLIDNPNGKFLIKL